MDDHDAFFTGGKIGRNYVKEFMDAIGAECIHEVSNYLENVMYIDYVKNVYGTNGDDGIIEKILRT